MPRHGSRSAAAGPFLGSVQGRKPDSKGEKRKDAVGSVQGVLSSFAPLALAFWDSNNIEAADKVATRLGQSIKVGAKEPEEEYRKAQTAWSRRVRCSDELLR